MHESLERRIACSATPFASLSAHGTLSVVGTGNDDSIVIGFGKSLVIAKRNGEPISFSANGVKRIWVNGFGGNDAITNDTKLPSTLLGGIGNDTINGGSGADSIDGGAGRDQLYGSAGNDNLVSFDSGCQMLGGNGNDVMFTQDGGRDTLDGGSGKDYAIVDQLDTHSHIETVDLDIVTP